MLFVLLRSGFEYLRLDRRGSSQELLNGLGARSAQLVTLVRCMAVAQVLLTVLAFTSYHVQIITRISSGYPVWYWWLAANLMDRKSKDPGNGIVMFMVMYASVQGALFASFLPPA